MTKVVAHRGLHRTARENTVAAFVAAREAGADGVELDVRACADGALVVFHDPAVDGQVIAGTPAGALPEHVARLSDALLACGDLWVNVEIKMDAYGAHDPRRAPFVERVVAQVDALGIASRVLYSSFDVSACRYLREVAPASPVGLLLDVADDPRGALELAVAAGFAALHPYFGPLSAQAVADVRAAGLALNVWTPNERDDLARLLDWGVDAVITDEPALALALRAERV
ncbi:MAG TPA: glycerophosphodiester phosphodiesterase [Acidimicrobiales bacterium]|nr:glycerophosphodiester phosphodiesterase [Acidimicrobiales bacterium]